MLAPPRRTVLFCPGNSGFDEWCIGLNFFDNDPYLSRNGNVEQIKGKGTEITIDETISFLRKHEKGDQPVLAVVWFPSPHDPHLEKPDPEGMYAGHKRAGYWGEISLLDAAFGRLRAEIDKLGMKDNTILWYSSDNGGLDKNTSGGRDRKGSIYEGGLRVPSMVQWPSRIKPGTTDVPGNSSDILPTILSMADVSRSGKLQLDGVDLSDIIAGKSSQHPAMGFWHGFQSGQSTWSDRILKAIMVAQQTGSPNPHQRRLKKDIEEFPRFSTEKLPGHAALLDWPWKLHRIEGKQGVKYELYNLATGPLEDKDLMRDPSNQERMERMKQELQKWQVSVVGSLNGEDYGPDMKPGRVGFYGLLSPEAGGGRFLQHAGQTKYVSVEPIVSPKDIESVNVLASTKTNKNVVRITLKGGIRDLLSTESRKTMPQIYGVVFVVDGEIKWVRGLNEVLANDKLNVMTFNDNLAAERLAKQLR